MTLSAGIPYLNSLRLVLVDIGIADHQSDGGILFNSAFGQALETNSHFIHALPNNRKGPYVIAGDEAFLLKSYMLSPYSGHFSR